MLLLAAAVVARSAEPPPAAVEARFPARAVIGLPLPVQFVVHGEAAVAAPRLMGEANPFLLELTSEEATYRFPARPFRKVRPDRQKYHRPAPEIITIPLQKTRIERGRSCEFVMDLGLLERFAVPRGAHRPVESLEVVQEAERQAQGALSASKGAGGSDIVPGEYVPHFLEPGFSFVCRPASVRLVAPNAEEKRLLRNLSRMGSTGPVWQALIERNARALAGVDVDRFSETGRRQLGYHLLLAKLVNSRRPIRELALPRSATDLLPAYATEVRLLRYEIETARGESRSAGETRRAVLAARPNAAALLEYIRDRGGTIARHRKALGRPAGRRARLRGEGPSSGERPGENDVGQGGPPPP